jgi:DNA-binding transcriptional LysR family regulator
VVFATQSTVSKAVKQLEDELGVSLLDRVGHRSTLTSAGDVVYRRALRLLAERDDLVAELEDLRDLKRGTLRLGFPQIGSNLLVPTFTTYRQRYPGIDIRLMEQGGQRVREMLLAGEIDLGASLLPVSDTFGWQKIRSEPLVALLPSSHPLARKKSIDLASLRELPFILFESGFALHRLVLDACIRRGFEPTIVAVSSQVEFMVELAAAGLGVAFLPRLIAEQRRRPALSLVLLDEPQTDWQAAMIWRRGGYLSQAAKAWLAIMRELDVNV